jgi:hypothetical protein
LKRKHQVSLQYRVKVSKDKCSPKLATHCLGWFSYHPRPMHDKSPPHHLLILIYATIPPTYPLQPSDSRHAKRRSMAQRVPPETRCPHETRCRSCLHPALHFQSRRNRQVATRHDQAKSVSREKSGMGTYCHRKTTVSTSKHDYHHDEFT